MLGEEYLDSHPDTLNFTLRINNSATGISAVSVSEANGIPTSNASFFDPIANTNNSSPFITSVLEVDFATPIRSFAVDSKTATDVGLMFFIYDSNDLFVSQLYDYSSSSSIPSPTNRGVFQPYRHSSLSFDFDVGKIVLGGAVDNHLITSISAPVYVSEPNLAVLCFGGLLSILGGKIFRLVKGQKDNGVSSEV